MLTLVLFKPDCVRRGLIGECLSRFERRGFRVAAIKVAEPIELNNLLHKHYQEHIGKPHFEPLMAMMSSGVIVACVLKGNGVVAQTRAIVGPYNDPVPGTIRGDFATSAVDNLVHTSDSTAAADREIEIWFPGVFE